MGKQLGRPIGQTLGADPAKRKKRRVKKAGDIPKRPGSRGRYTGREPGGKIEDLESQATQPKERGTLPERIWEKWLIQQRVLHQMQRTFGDVRFKGTGNISDIYLPAVGSRGTIISVVGLYWHFDTFERDRQMYQRLTSKGYRVISSYEDDIYRHAIQGTFGSYANNLISGGSGPPVKITQQRLRNVL